MRYLFLLLAPLAAIPVLASGHSPEPEVRPDPQVVSAFLERQAAREAAGQAKSPGAEGVASLITRAPVERSESLLVRIGG